MLAATCSIRFGRRHGDEFNLGAARAGGRPPPGSRPLCRWAQAAGRPVEAAAQATVTETVGNFKS